jgi:hypothetical protein
VVSSKVEIVCGEAGYFVGSCSKSVESLFVIKHGFFKLHFSVF